VWKILRIGVAGTWYEDLGESVEREAEKEM
jgi:hypothetical protein